MADHLVSEEERHKILVEWNSTYADFPLDLCLHQLFESQVERSAKNVAVVFKEQHLTYQEFNQRANQLAHYLRRLGVGPEVLVGVCMERSLEMVIGLYAILKAGGAYVPLDPDFPAERLEFMLEDTQVPIVLAQTSTSARLASFLKTIIRLDAEWPEIANEPRENIAGPVTPENLAYVIYTSGSTGKPKGVMNVHKGICNRLLWMQREYQLTKEDRVLQKTPFSFDVSVWEFFWPLLAGARLVVAEPGGHKDSSYLVRLINEQGITTLHFVPSMLRVFLTDRSVGTCRSIKRVIASGEALTYELQERFFATLNGELHNLYGPTEAAIDVTYYACQRGRADRIVPIGRPVSNTQIYLLNEQMMPVPVGTDGELCIGGVQVARGYLNRPELTAERFVADPFSPKPGAKLYRTGDLARYLPDGNIVFSGRMDDQIKIRGFRVELGEIETALAEHPAVRQAAVTAPETELGDRRLIAYLVLDKKAPEPSETSVAIENIKSYLQKKLPDYMVPSVFILLDSLPMTSSGKLDRKALPSLDRARPNLGRAYIAPRTELERRLAGMWGEVLNLDQLGIHDRFFELGGDSIRAALFVNRLQKELNEFIYIVTIFESPTVAAYAAFLDKDYSGAVARWVGEDKQEKPIRETVSKADGTAGRVDYAMVAKMRQYIPTLPPSGKSIPPREAKNPPAMFILAPPRSGTTLLRVMLAGHPRIFAAPELQLLCFNTLQERKSAFSGKFSAWLEGSLRAIMELKNCQAEEAKRIMQSYEDQGYTTKAFYRVLQDWIGDRILLEKTPAYALDLDAMKKAEQDFDGNLYIHLARHPYSSVRSFESMHMDQILYLYEHPFNLRQLGELVWTISHQNIIEFLKTVPENRQFFMTFEELTARPKEVMEAACRRLGLEFHPNILEPYKNKEKKMVDGIYPESLPMGDVKFLKYISIRTDVAEAWKGVESDNFLGEVTWETAQAMGYKKPDSGGRTSSSRRVLAEKQREIRLSHRKSSS